MGKIIRTLVPPPVAPPRGALWAATAAAWLCLALRRGWRFLARHWPSGRRRPQSAEDLVALAREVESEQPSLAAELRGIARHKAAAVHAESGS